MASSDIIQINPAEKITERGYKELRISNVYLHHAFHPPSQTHLTILKPNGFQGLGETVANNWTVHDGPDPLASNVIARAQGTHIHCGNWHNSFTLVFEIDRLKGSTLVVMGVGVSEGQWAIVGGTGHFTMAQGYINKKDYKDVHTGKVIELDIYAIFRLTELQLVQPYKDGPKGGQGGESNNEPQHEPWRLERVKLNHGHCILSFEFSYVDKDGVRHTEGPWGGRGIWKYDEVNFGPTEFVKEISGTVGQYAQYTVVTSLRIITNIRTYGPYGTETGTPFSLPEKKNGNVVGFFGRSGGCIDSLGVLVCP